MMLDISAPFLVARTYQHLAERGLPPEPEALAELDFRWHDGERWRKTQPPRAVVLELTKAHR